MNPYLVETFVKTTGSHHNVTDNFGNTDGFVSTVLTPVNTTLKHVKANSNKDDDLFNELMHDLEQIKQQNTTLWYNLVKLGARLKKTNSSSPNDVAWANTNSITLRNNENVNIWWQSLKWPSRLLCYDYVNSKNFKK